MPGCKRIALISNARHPGEENEIAACRTLVERAGLMLSVHKSDNAAGLKPALAEALGSEAQAVLVLPSSLMVRNAAMLAGGCIERKVPLISGWSDMARSGALLTYGPNLERAYESIANYAVRILNGTSPEVLPIEQPTEFELAINRGTAAALGITLPPSLLAQANELFD